MRASSETSRPAGSAPPLRAALGLQAGALAAFVSLVLLRLPTVTAQGRFWAEEGRVYFHNACVLPWWQAIFRPANGYLSLYANVSGLLARYCVPLEQAPRLTTVMALLAQCLPVLVLLGARDCWLRPVPVRFAAVLLIAMPPVCDEVWLNTANSQFHIALAAALCLALDAPSGWPGRRRGALLFLAPLCSPTAIVLAPLFVLRAVWDRQRARALQAACILAGVLPQLAIMAAAPLHGRGALIGPTIMACVFAAKHLAIPFLGEDAASGLVPGWYATVHAGHVPLAPVAAVAAAAALLVWALAESRRPAAFYFAASGLALAVLSYNGAVGGGIALIDVVSGGRYAFAPAMLFALTVAALCGAGNRFVAHGAKMVLAWLLAVAVWQTWLPQDRLFAEGPLWRREVARVRADPAYAPHTWPAGWVVRLQP